MCAYGANGPSSAARKQLQLQQHPMVATADAGVWP